MKQQRLKFLASILASSPGILYFYSPMVIVLTIICVATPFATGRFIDALAYHQSPYPPFAVLAILLLLKTGLNPLLQRIICVRSRTLEYYLQFKILDATMNLQPYQLANLDDGSIIAKLTRDSFAIGGFVRGFYPRLLQTVVMMLAAGIALFTRSPVLAVAFMAFFPLAIFLFFPFSKRFSENSHRVRIQSDTSLSNLFDFLNTLPLLRDLDAERRFDTEPKNALRELTSCNKETDSLTIRFGFLLGLLLVIVEVAVLGFAGTLAAKGRIPVGDVVLYQMLFVTAIQSIQGIIGLLPDLATIREGADSLCEVLVPPSPTTLHPSIDQFSSLTFQNISFSYPRTAEQPVIRNFSAEFHAGTIVGLSGANGAGKSTLLKLAVNALEPQQGTILINGSPFSEINLAAFRQRIGIVFQDNLLISGTIRDNITLRNPAFTCNDIDQALTLSGFDSVVQRLPLGLDTPVGNRIRTLSGGERQRLALARAIIRNPMILILDEATNHLDSESRKRLAALVTKLRPGRLILLAGHDHELEKICDRKIFCQIL